MKLRILLLLSLAPIGAAHAAAPLTQAQVRERVAGTPPGTRIDLSGEVLRNLDLTGFDLSGADLRKTDLSGARLDKVKLVGADLTDADLSGARLEFVWIIRANFTRADLSGAVLQALVSSQGMETTQAEAAIFADADFSGATVNVQFRDDDMHGADFAHARMAVDMHNQSMGLLRTDFTDANLVGANFSDATLGHVSFHYAKLHGADFRGAQADHAEFTGADLTDADFTGAKLDGADFSGATLTGVKGLPGKDLRAQP